MATIHTTHMSHRYGVSGCGMSDTDSHSLSSYYSSVTVYTRKRVPM